MSDAISFIQLRVVPDTHTHTLSLSSTFASHTNWKYKKQPEQSESFNFKKEKWDKSRIFWIYILEFFLWLYPLFPFFSSNILTLMFTYVG